MMKTGIKCLIAAACVVLGAWTTGQSSDIKKSEWLIGTWESKSPKGTMYETWRRISDNELSGKSYMLQQQDTVVFERVRLVQEDSGLYYIPTVEGQNNNLPVRFAATAVSEVQLVFENPQHDFPQTISYTKTGADSLIAEISGAKNGRERRQRFPMRQVK